MVRKGAARVPGYELLPLVATQKSLPKTVALNATKQKNVSITNFIYVFGCDALRVNLKSVVFFENHEANHELFSNAPHLHKAD